MVNKPKLFLDMDNVLVDTLTVLNQLNPADYQVNKPDQIPGVFLDLQPVEGALESVKSLAPHYDLYILSTAPWHNPSAWQDKLLWLEKYFGNDEDSPFYKRVVMTHDKGLVHGVGGILVDDRPYHGASSWDDEQTDSVWLQYGHDERLVWSKNLTEYLIDVARKFESTRSLRLAVQKANDQDYQIFGDKQRFNKAHWE
jgi:hypothetical protein